MAIAVGTNSWVTEAIANTYLGSRLDADGYWVDGDANNERALITAYRWLVGSGDFTFPATATQAMKDAQCEYALFLLQHQPDIDLRIGLQVQGVVAAGIVKEKYKESTTGMPYPPIVRTLLRSYLTYASTRLVDLERDEEEGVDYDAYGNR